MTTTTLPHLRPFGLGQLFDQAIRLYRRNFLTFIGIVAIVQIPIGLLQLVMSVITMSSLSSQLMSDPGQTVSGPSELFGLPYFLGIGGSFLVGIVGFILVQGLATAALTRAIAGSYLGESIGILDAYEKIGRSWLPLLGALLLAGVISLGLVIWFLIPCVGWITGIGILAFFAMVVIPLIAPIVVLERLPAVSSIRRAWDLARRRFWWVLGFVFLLFLFSQIVVSGPVMLLSFIFQLVAGSPLDVSFTQNIVQTVLQSLVGLVFGVIYLPLHLTAITLLYFDLRVRTEGFDLALLSTSTSGSPSEVAEITAQAPPPDRGNLVTWTEMGYFALVSVGGLVLYFALISVLGFAVMMIMGGLRGF